MNGNRMPALPVAEKSAADGDKAVEIKVVALRPGFYKNRRKVLGDEFVVKKFEEVGAWMKCVDPLLQKKHKENQAKLKKLRAGASKDSDGE